MHTKTIIFVAGVAAGIIVGLTSAFGTELAVAALTLAGIQGIMFAITRKRETKSLALSLFTSILCFAFFLGVFRAQMIEEKSSYVCDDACAVNAVIVSSPESKDVYQTFVIRPKNADDALYDIQVRTSLYPKYSIGEKLVLSGKVKEPDVIFPHGDQKPFDYVSYLHEKNVGSEMLFPKIEMIGKGEKNVTATLGEWKEHLVGKLNSYVASPANMLANGMLFGNSGMSKELSDAFRVAGLSHIIVLSGFNIAIVIAFILFVFAFLPLALRVTLAALSVVTFVMMVGGEASVIRATIMSFIALLAMLSGREYAARQALMLSFFAILMYEPTSIFYDVSFHLSFLATFGIVYGSEPIKEYISRYVQKRSLVELLTTTLAAYLATLPYIMYAFGMVSMYAFVANILVLPLVPLAMLLSFLTLVFSFISHVVSLAFGFADSVLITFIISMVRMIGKLPGSSFSFSISFRLMCITYMMFALLIFYFSRNKKDETLLTTKEGYLTGVISY